MVQRLDIQTSLRSSSICSVPLAQSGIPGTETSPVRPWPGAPGLPWLENSVIARGYLRLLPRPGAMGRLRPLADSGGRSAPLHHQGAAGWPLPPLGWRLCINSPAPSSKKRALPLHTYVEWIHPETWAFPLPGWKCQSLHHLDGRGKKPAESRVVSSRKGLKSPRERAPSPESQWL